MNLRPVEFKMRKRRRSNLAPRFSGGIETIGNTKYRIFSDGSLRLPLVKVKGKRQRRLDKKKRHEAR